MSEVLYFEHLLLRLNLADKRRRLMATEATIGHAAGDNLDWKEDAAFEQAQRQFHMDGSLLADADVAYKRVSRVVEPYKKAPVVSVVSIGTDVLLEDTDDHEERFLVGGVSDINGSSLPADAHYQGRLGLGTPLGKKLIGKKQDDEFPFMDLKYRILEVSWGVPGYLSFFVPMYLQSATRGLDEDIQSLSNISLDVDKLPVLVRLMKNADRIVFARQVAEDYTLADLSGLRFPKGYMRHIDELSTQLNIRYEAFTVMNL